MEVLCDTKKCLNQLKILFWLSLHWPQNNLQHFLVNHQIVHEKNVHAQKILDPKVSSSTNKILQFHYGWFESDVKLYEVLKLNLNLKENKKFKFLNENKKSKFFEKHHLWTTLQELYIGNDMKQNLHKFNLNHYFHLNFPWVFADV